MLKSFPTYRQRIVLQNLLDGEFHHAANLGAVGAKTLRTLARTGWIESTTNSEIGAPVYRITESGRLAFHARMPIYG